MTENDDLRCYLLRCCRYEKYTNSYETAARGTTRESTGNKFYWKSLGETHKHRKALKNENTERGERPVRAV